MTTLFFIEHANGKVNDQSLKAISATKEFGGEVHGLIAGSNIESAHKINLDCFKLLSEK